MLNPALLVIAVVVLAAIVIAADLVVQILIEKWQESHSDQSKQYASVEQALADKYR